MLVLTRKLGERIQIGDAINLVVVGMQANRVRIGIEAPREVAVARAEICELRAVAQAGGKTKVLELQHAAGND